MPTEHFSIHASVVFQLGETLITDEIQALVELVKNCYDAEATRVRLVVDTKSAMPVGSAFPDAKGFIHVDDDGTGMDLETIRRGWLTISNSIKREVKRAGKVAAGKRTPLGDKGLGRLGAQRLGHNIEIWTRLQGQDIEYHVSFSWRDFADKELLQEVTVQVSENHKSTGKPGTRILISDLANLEYWEGNQSRDNLEVELGQMLSPYGEVQNFKIDARLNGEKIDVIGLVKSIRTASEVHYDLNFNGEVLLVKGKARLGFFRSQNENADQQWVKLVEPDRGERLFKFLSSRQNMADYHLSQSEDKTWFVDFDFEMHLDEITNIRNSDDSIPNPGAFYGEVDSFDLGVTASREQTIRENRSDYRKLVKKLSGIRVYRDGFGIRVDQDWIGLGGGWTSALSYYGLKPNNVMGYIALSASGNGSLQETTNRQDFVQNEYYRVFYQILQKWKQFTERIHEALRRAANDYYISERVEVAPAKTPEGLAKILTENLGRARTVAKPLTNLRAALASTVDSARRTVLSVQKSSTLFSVEPEQQKQLEQSVLSFEKDAGKVEEIVKDLDRVVIELASLEQQSHLIRDQVIDLRERITETYETVSLGITAEALTHEIFNITDRLAEQTRWIRLELKKRNIVVAELVTYLERVSQSVSALRKQLGHLDPSLRYLRENREDINLVTFFGEQEDFFRERFAKNQVQVNVVNIDNQSFVIRMNKGKMVQIVDNLFLNSEYWLREQIRLKKITQGTITVELDAPFIRIFDNGPGIAPQVENSVFEPFVSLKERGRGLGLYIIRQLLETEGCQIELLPALNVYGRPYIFGINVAAAIVGHSDKNG